MKKGNGSRDLLRVAEQVADGAPVDWNKTSESDPDSQGKIRHLQLVEQIGAAHRSILGEAETGEGTLETTPSRWGPLQIVARIGVGGYGEVFLAHDPTLQRDVALKIPHPERARRGLSDESFLDEARKLARVRHPNVLVVHGADSHDGRVGLWTDLLKGKTLEECLRERGAFGAEEASLIGLELCRALAAVHAAGLVHRDVKTANIMREEGGRVVLMDFSAVTDLSESSRETVGGTPVYMAPESFLGRDCGISSDIYALGVVLYRLVTGRYPVDATSIEDLREKHRCGESTPLRDLRPDLPTTFVNVVERALLADPGRRYASVGEMERELATALGVTPPDEPDVRKEPASWRPWAVAAALVVVAALVAWVIPWGAWLGRFDVDASLFRVGEGAEERLLPGGSVAPGDSLFLEISGSRPMHVYVLNEDRAGEKFQLFPLPDLDLKNPLTPGEKHRLPGTVDGVPHYWDVTSEGGEELVVVIASRDPLPDLEREVEGLLHAGPPGLPMALDDLRAARALRGIGGLSSAPHATDGSDSRISGISERLSEQAAETSGLWVWEMRLKSTDSAP